MENPLLNYEAFNDILYNRHPNLSSEWTDVVAKEDGSLEISYPMEDDTEETVIISPDGSLTVSEQLIQEMDSIQ
tara:strand:+ start:83 stop:304 length:222 start_codon:yes stop_codon:yes gene_type:complete